MTKLFHGIIVAFCLLTRPPLGFSFSPAPSFDSSCRKLALPVLGPRQPQQQRFAADEKKGCSHEIFDDDDISQESFMEPSHLHDDSEVQQPPEGGGYRRIEDWHKENRNEKHVLTHLKQERAKWAMKFEDLGGDGI